MKRLLTIGHSYTVGMNRRLAHEMASLGRGWEVTVVAPTFVHGDLQPIRLEVSPDEPCRVRGVRSYFTKPVHVMLYGPRLRSILREGWDLVHCWEEPFVLAGGQVARWTPRDVPLVFWTAQNLAKRYPPPFSWIERYVLRRASGWLACGETTRAAMLPRGFDTRPHRVIPLGADTDAFRPDPAARAAVHRRLGWTEPGPPVVGYSGRFVEEKGVTFLAEVLDQLPCGWRALFIGDGPLRGRLEAWAARHGDRVRIASGIGHDDVPAMLAAMDVLAAPSRTTPRWHEQLGRMLLEGFACGLAVVASDSGEIPYVVDEAEIVAAEDDHRAWGDALVSLLTNADGPRDLGRRGRARAMAEFAWPVVAGRHLDFFEELLATSSARRVEPVSRLRSA